MRRALGITFAALLLTPLLFWLSLRLGLLTPLANLILRQELDGRSPVQVRLGSLRSDLLSFVEADDVVVLAPLKGGAKLPLLTLASLRLEVKVYDAWRGRLPWSEALRLARLRGLNVFVLRSTDGEWNLSALAQSGPKRGKKEPSKLSLVIPAGRVELEDSQVVVNDELREFRATIEGVQGSLDTRALPLLAFSLNARTEGHTHENLSLAGEWDQRDLGLDARLDLANVALSSYLNYLMPEDTVRFEGGSASLSARLSRGDSGRPWSAKGRAQLSGGRLRIPGVAQPVDRITGSVDFDPKALRFRGLSAHFLAADWSASGALLDLRKPTFDVQLSNAVLDLSELSREVQGLDALSLSGTALVSATLQGPVAAPVIEAQLKSEAFGLLGAQMDQVSAEAQLHGSRLKVSRFRGMLWGGHLEGEADMGLARGGKLRAELQLDGAELAQARIHGIQPLPMSGTAWAQLRTRGLLRAPELELDLEVSRSAIGGFKLGSLEAEAAWSPKAWSASFKALSGSVKGQLFAEGKNGGSFSRSHIELKDLDLGATVQGLAEAPRSLAIPDSAVQAALRVHQRFTAKGTLNLSLDGPVRAPRLGLDLDAVQGRLMLTSGLLKLDKPERGLDFMLQGRVGLGLVDGELYFGTEKRPLRLLLGSDGEIEATALGHMPWARRGSGGDLELELKADLDLLEQLDLFGKSGGRLGLKLRLGGSFDNTVSEGMLLIDGFRTQPDRYLAPIKQGSFRAQFKGQRVDLEELSLQAGGHLQASGMLDLAGGLKGAKGKLRVKTDKEGLRLEDWPKLGSGNVVLDPLDLAWEGETEPLVVQGRATLSNALVIYGGAEADDKVSGTAKTGPGRPLDLDLRVGLGANVWYEKRQHKSVDIFDPAKALSGAWDSLAETFLQPDLFFRLRPSDQDFVISGSSPEIRVSGELVIDRGRLTMMENDFTIRSEQTVSKIVFQGQRAEIWADASARLRYTRDDPLTGRPRTHVVTVRAEVRPLPEEELLKTNLADSKLNYHLARFVSDPPIIRGDEALERSAILNLVVFGDPMVDLQGNGGAIEIRNGASDNVALETQLNRVLSAEARKQVAKWSRYGFKFLGNNLIDVFRVVPRFKYQSASGAQTGGGSAQATAGQASKQAQESALVWSDLTFEIGKSLGEKLYASGQFVFFGENGLNQGSTNSLNSTNQVVRDRGVRAGLEYQVSSNRTLELYYNYSVDDNLEPVPFDPAELRQAHSAALRLRNTIPTENYTPALAQRRRWEIEKARETPVKRLRLDLHSHTWYSHDSLLQPGPFIAACLAKGINAIAVTDHNEIEGALHIARLAPFKVIIGEEIRTREGEISGLFLKQRIPPNLSPEETVHEIRRQKGLVYIPHPFASGVTMRITAAALARIEHQVDIVEGFNARALLRSDDLRAQNWARKRDIPFAAGSDAHTRFEIGAAFVELNDFSTPKGLVKALRSGLLYGKKTHMAYPAASLAVGLTKKGRRRQPPAQPF